MAISVYFHPKSLSAEQYDEAVRQVDAAGARQPAGRIHHSCFGPDGDLMVYEVWESQQAFEDYGVRHEAPVLTGPGGKTPDAGVLMPILHNIGIDPGTPDVMPVHNLEI